MLFSHVPLLTTALPATSRIGLAIDYIIVLIHILLLYIYSELAYCRVIVYFHTQFDLLFHVHIHLRFCSSCIASIMHVSSSTLASPWRSWGYTHANKTFLVDRDLPHLRPSLSSATIGAALVIWQASKYYDKIIKNIAGLRTVTAHPSENRRSPDRDPAHPNDHVGIRLCHDEVSLRAEAGHEQVNEEHYKMCYVQQPGLFSHQDGQLDQHGLRSVLFTGASYI